MYSQKFHKYFPQFSIYLGRHAQTFGSPEHGWVRSTLRKDFSKEFRIFWISKFSEIIGFSIFAAHFGNSLRNQIFPNLTNFWFEYCNPKLCNARNPNLSSESPCGMTFAWKCQFQNFSRHGDATSDFPFGTCFVRNPDIAHRVNCMSRRRCPSWTFPLHIHIPSGQFPFNSLSKLGISFPSAHAPLHFCGHSAVLIAHSLSDCTFARDFHRPSV